jgi:hypothetical protein
MRRDHGLVKMSRRTLLDVPFPMILDFRVKFGDLTLLLFFSGTVATWETGRR